MFAPVLISAQRRAVWLGINLITAFLASWVIGMFEATIEKVVALAVLMPIVASMGGIAGSQTLTLTIRGIALGQLSASNTRWLVLKELAVGALNSIIWAAVVAVVAGIWFDSTSIALLIAAAISINLIFAALTGAVLPIALDKVGIDPALAGSVLLTTVTDIVGFLAFLGLATLFLL
jgi:magnesium transporter